ncbi:unnamed protein product [Ranitomeya imitator]|uniref:Uncharacterized protein n=1 Tax=Ranitomeya imitator TaxID=111125 RepID=A0ABN9MQ48_9NEOB|nr:unnamed protein product [Ranitomeya imitator]
MERGDGKEEGGIDWKRQIVLLSSKDHLMLPTERGSREAGGSTKDLLLPVGTVKLVRVDGKMDEAKYRAILEENLLGFIASPFSFAPSSTLEFTASIFAPSSTLRFTVSSFSFAPSSTMGFTTSPLSLAPSSTLGFTASIFSLEPSSTLGFTVSSFSPAPSSTLGFTASIFSLEPSSTLGFTASSFSFAPSSTMGFTASSFSFAPSSTFRFTASSFSFAPSSTLGFTASSFSFAPSSTLGTPKLGHPLSINCQSATGQELGHDYHSAALYIGHSQQVQTMHQENLTDAGKDLAKTKMTLSTDDKMAASGMTWLDGPENSEHTRGETV